MNRNVYGVILLVLGSLFSAPAEAQFELLDSGWRLSGGVREGAAITSSFSDFGTLSTDNVTYDVLNPSGTARVFANFNANLLPDATSIYALGVASSLATINLGGEGTFAGGSFVASLVFRWTGPDHQRIFVGSALSNQDTTNANASFALREFGSLTTNFVLPVIYNSYYQQSFVQLQSAIDRDIANTFGETLLCSSTLGECLTVPTGTTSSSSDVEIVKPASFAAASSGPTFPPPIQTYEFDIETGRRYVATIQLSVSHAFSEADTAFLAGGGFYLSAVDPQLAAIPEPETYALLLAGLGLLGFGAWVRGAAPKEAASRRLAEIGRSWRIRTADQRIKSPLLYQLS